MKKTFTILFWIYMAVVFRITVFRSGFGSHKLLQEGSVNLTLFLDYVPLLQEGNWVRFLYLFVGNIIWFVPFGMYLQYMHREKGTLRIVCYGFLFSLTIETLQYIFGTGYSELDDLVLNTFGTWLGARLWYLCSKKLCRGCAETDQ